MLYLITGGNGSGKSLRSVWRMKRDLDNGLQVFASGFKELKLPGVIPFPDPRKWQEIPPGSVLYVDEAQEVWRSRTAAARVPSEVLAMETHRHGGIDIVLITQSPSFIDSHIRHLLSGEGAHEHLIAYGDKKSRLFSFAECYDDVRSLATRARGEFEVWDHPTELYGMYFSASVHIKKGKIPWKQRVGRPLLFAVAGLCLAYVVWQGYDLLANGGMSDRVRAAEARAKGQGKGASSLAAFASGLGGRRKGYANLQDYVLQHQPRMAEMPWTMPVLDDRKVTVDPAVYCMASGEEWETDASCTCLTEQGTRYLLPPARCRYIARHGGAYNPYKQPVKPSTGRAETVASGPGSADGAFRVIGGSVSPEPETPPAAEM